MATSSSLAVSTEELRAEGTEQTKVTKKKIVKATKEKAGKEQTTFVWTDDETELLLKVTLEYKVSKTAENVDWESVRSKYTDIWELMLAQLPSTPEAAKELGKDYPHKKEDITKQVLTSKVKGIRLKYRQAVDCGRRSGHGRVVLLYFELCEKIWGGSPATEQIAAGVETTDLDTTQK